MTALCVYEKDREEKTERRERGTEREIEIDR